VAELIYSSPCPSSAELEIYLPEFNSGKKDVVDQRFALLRPIIILSVTVIKKHCHHSG